MVTQILTKLMSWISQSWNPQVAEKGNVTYYFSTDYFLDYNEYFGF